MTIGSLMKVKSIAECSLGAFCNTFDLHTGIIGLKNIFGIFESGCFTQVLLYHSPETLGFRFFLKFYFIMSLLE